MRTETIIKTYGLPVHLAREIVADETQKILPTRWQAWAWLLLTFALYVWLQFFGPADFQSAAFWVLLGGLSCWVLMGRHYATSAIHRAAKDRADRLAGKYQ